MLLLHIFIFGIKNNMTLKDAQKWLSEIKYKDYGFALDYSSNYSPYVANNSVVLYCFRDDVDSITGEKSTRTTEYSMEIENMDASAFVHKVFGFILGLAQHEACEFFKFMDIAIFNPHANVFTLQYALRQTLEKL